MLLPGCLVLCDVQLLDVVCACCPVHTLGPTCCEGYENLQAPWAGLPVYACLYMHDSSITILTHCALQVKAHQQDGHEFAVKWMKYSDSQFNLEEARTLWALKEHENVVQMLAAVTDDNGAVVGIMMELCELTLSDMVEQYNVGLKGQVTIARHVASGCMALHTTGMVHADIKSNNVLLRPAVGGGYISKLCDFGCAEAIGSGALLIQYDARHRGAICRKSLHGWAACHHVAAKPACDVVDHHSQGSLTCC